MLGWVSPPRPGPGGLLWHLWFPRAAPRAPAWAALRPLRPHVLGGVATAQAYVLARSRVLAQPLQTREGEAAKPGPGGGCGDSSGDEGRRSVQQGRVTGCQEEDSGACGSSGLGGSMERPPPQKRCRQVRVQRVADRVVPQVAIRKRLGVGPGPHPEAVEARGRVSGPPARCLFPPGTVLRRESGRGPGVRCGRALGLPRGCSGSDSGPGQPGAHS